LNAQAVARPDAAAAIDRLRPAIAAAQHGDQAAFKDIYHEYARPVYNLVFRSVRHPQVSEDVCQEIWAKVFRELPKLQDAQAFPAWLYRIATRACVDAARHSRRLPPTTELPEERLTHAEGDPERSALRREQVRLTWEALATMPTRQHVALYLREIERMSYKDIARMLDSSESAVEMLLFRARRGFAKAYEQLEAATEDRCQHAKRSMAAIIDGEATPVQQNAIRAHADACRPCSGELVQMRRAATAYSALLPFPVPALLSERILESIGGNVTTASGPPTLVAKILGLAAANAKVAGITVVATTVTATAAVAAVNSPIADEIRPGGSIPVSERQAAGGGPVDNIQVDPLSNEAAGAQLPADVQPNSPADAGLADPSTTQSLNELTMPVISIVDQTTTDLAGTVGTLIEEIEQTTGPLPTVPPLPLETPANPTVPSLPTIPPVPSIPPLPTVPPLIP
jgi:RNA polymerase sigma-70 factor (ECF subfamily)